MEQNAARAAEKAAAVPEHPRSIMERLQQAKAPKTAPKKDGLQRLVDREAKKAEGKVAGYDRWATTFNLKQMAATMLAYQDKYGFSSPEELDESLAAARTGMKDSLAGLKELEAAIKEKKELQHHLLSYIGTKPVRDGLKAQKTEKARKAYRQKHEGDFILADTAATWMECGKIQRVPSHPQ